MSRQDFKDIKKAFKDASTTLENTLDDFANNHDLSKSANSDAAPGLDA